MTGNLHLSWPRGHFVAYYFRLRRMGHTPKGARNVVFTHAQARVVDLGQGAAKNYQRPNFYSGD